MALSSESSSDEDKPFECLVCLQDVRHREGECDGKPAECVSLLLLLLLLLLLQSLLA